MKTMFVPWLLMACNFDHNRPKGRTWQSKGGVRVRGGGIPFGRARLLLIYLATRARDVGPTIEGSFRDLTRAFDVESWKDALIAEQLGRLLGARFDVPDLVDEQGASSWIEYRRLDLFAPGSRFNATRKRFSITLSDWFFQHVQESVEVDAGLVRSMVSHLATLDLFCWYSWRIHRGDFEPVCPFGPDGPCDLLQGPRAYHRMRQEFPIRHARVVAKWPDCPFLYHKSKGKLLYIPSIVDIDESGDPIASELAQEAENENTTPTPKRGGVPGKASCDAA